MARGIVPPVAREPGNKYTTECQFQAQDTPSQQVPPESFFWWEIHFLGWIWDRCHDVPTPMMRLFRFFHIGFVDGRGKVHTLFKA
jgi:hypothetical protein